MTTSHDNLEHRLEEFYAQVPPPPGKVSGGRERMLAEAARLRAQVTFRPLSAGSVALVKRRQRGRKVNLSLVYKAIVAVMAVVLVTAAAGGGVVLASANSLPGEALYPAKLFVEDTRLALTSDPAALADLNLAFTGERTEEMQRLLAQGELVPQDAIERMTRHTHQFMEHIAQAQPEEVPGLLERVMTRTRSQMQILDQVGVAVPEDAQDALRHAQKVARRAYETAGAAQGDPERFQKEYKLRHWGSADPQGPSDEAGPPDEAPRGPSDDAGSPDDTPQGPSDNADPRGSPGSP